MKLSAITLTLLLALSVSINAQTDEENFCTPNHCIICTELFSTEKSACTECAMSLIEPVNKDAENVVYRCNASKMINVKNCFSTKIDSDGPYCATCDEASGFHALVVNNGKVFECSPKCDSKDNYWDLLEADPEKRCKKRVKSSADLCKTPMIHFDKCTPNGCAPPSNTLNRVYNPTTQQCEVLVPFCVAGTFDNCTTCSEGYTSIGSQCVKELIANCQVGVPNQNLCTQCRVGFALSADRGSCNLHSDPNCKTPFGQGNDGCEACKDGYFVEQCVALPAGCTAGEAPKAGQTEPSCTACSAGFFLNPGSKKCEGPVADCMTAENAEKCLTCKSGFFKDAEGKCKALSANCTEGTDAETCTACMTGFYLFDKKCHSIQLVGCTRATATTLTNYKCTHCIAGLTLYSDGCGEVLKYCTAQTKVGICDTCTTGYIKKEGETFCYKPTTIANCNEYTDVKTCKACNSGYFLDSNNTACTKVEGENCTEGTDKTTCTACKDGFTLAGGTACAAITAGNCRQGPNADGTACVTCQLGYWNNSGACTTMTGSAPNENSVACLEATSATVCTSCQFAVNANGVLQYYGLVGNECWRIFSNPAASNANNYVRKFRCKTWDSNRDCATCHPNFFLYEKDCFPKDENCKTFGATGCTECNNDFYPSFDKKSCLPKITHCLTQTKRGFCSQCKPGYYYDAAKMACLENNAGHCNAASRFGCTTCLPGYYRLPVTRCTKIKAKNCSQSQQLESCTRKCADGFIAAQNGKTVECREAQESCAKGYTEVVAGKLKCKRCQGVKFFATSVSSVYQTCDPIDENYKQGTVSYVNTADA